MGFSTTTCLPSSMALTAMSVCMPEGVQMQTTSNVLLADQLVKVAVDAADAELLGHGLGPVADGVGHGDKLGLVGIWRIAAPCVGPMDPQPTTPNLRTLSLTPSVSSQHRLRCHRERLQRCCAPGSIQSPVAALAGHWRHTVEKRPAGRNRARRADHHRPAQRRLVDKMIAGLETVQKTQVSATRGKLLQGARNTWR